MSTKNYFLIKACVFLWVSVCVVVAEHQKRDVHRIILKERTPRSHGRGHGNHNHGRKKGHHHKKSKKGSEESHSISFEDSAGFSNENNFEDFFQKAHKSSHRNPSFSHQHFPPNLDIEESRHYPFKEEIKPFFNSEWVPINNEYSTSNSHELHHKERDRRNKRKPKKHTNKSINKPKPFGNLSGYPNNILVTHRGKPFSTDLASSQNTLGSTFTAFESSTLYPPIDVLSSFSALNKKLLEPNPSNFEQSSAKDDSNRLKNHRSNYNTNEGEHSGLNGFIMVPDKSEFASLELNSPEKFETKTTPKIRGNVKFNGQL